MSEPYTPTEDDLTQGKIHLGDNYWRELTEDEARRGIAQIKAEAWDECAAQWDRYCIGVREYNEGEAAFPDTPINPYREETT